MTPAPHYTRTPEGYAYTGPEGDGVVLSSVAVAYEAHSGRILMHGRPERVRGWVGAWLRALNRAAEESRTGVPLAVRAYEFPSDVAPAEINRSLWNPYYFLRHLGLRRVPRPTPCPEEFLA